MGRGIWYDETIRNGEEVILFMIFIILILCCIFGEVWNARFEDGKSAALAYARYYYKPTPCKE